MKIRVFIENSWIVLRYMTKYVKKVENQNFRNVLLHLFDADKSIEFLQKDWGLAPLPYERSSDFAFNLPNF